jgi:hypothetical protein
LVGRGQKPHKKLIISMMLATSLMKPPPNGPLALVIVAVLSLPSAGLAANRANVSPQELAKAINQADFQSVPYRNSKLSPADIRNVRCVAPDEEPTEFECTWQQRTNTGWIKRQTSLAVDGGGWHVID